MAFSVLTILDPLTLNYVDPVTLRNYTCLMSCAPAVNTRSTALPPQYVPPTLPATSHTDLPPPSLFVPSTLSFRPPATLLPICLPSSTPSPLCGLALDV